MAGSNSSVKRQKQSERRRSRNKSVRSEVRTSVKKFLQAVASSNRQDAEKRLLETQTLIDKAVGKGVYHRNTGARTKSRLTKRLNKLSV